jgi:hypothetical protein
MHDAHQKAPPVLTDGQVVEIPAVCAIRTGEVYGGGHQEWH